MADEMLRGSCLCGAVTFRISGKLGPADACHCSQCRKMTGHYLASVNVAVSDLELEGGDQVRWFDSSEQARRGFCPTCGSTLFWQANGSDRIAVAMGAWDGATRTRIEMHIFVADKGDYYEIEDGARQYPRLPDLTG